MPKVTFTRDFHWHVRPSVTISYKANNEYPVTQKCADEAAEAGAVEARRVKRGEE